MKMTTNNIPQGKVTPLGIIPNEWEILQLKKLGEIYSGGTPNTNEPNYWNGNILWCTPSDITKLKTRFIGDTNQRITPLGLKNSSATLLPPGSILVCTRATIGNAAITIKETSTNQGFKNIKPIKGINVDWLFYYITLNKHRIVQLGVGSTFLEVSKKDFENFKIIVPPFPEQQKIAEVLSTWDKAIEKQSQLIEKLELRKKGLMQQLLTGKKRLPGFSSKWKTIKLGDISKRIVRRNINEQCTNVVTISAQKGFIRQTDFFNKKVASETIENYYLVKRNEFCYNKSYSNGFPMGAIKRLKEFDQAVVTTLYICFAVQEERISVDFIEQYFSLGLLNRGLMKIANEGGRAHGLLNVTPNDFFNINLNLPPIDEQKAISSILFNAYNEVVLAKNKIKSLQEQKKGLMQVLLTGKKRIIQ